MQDCTHFEVDAFDLDEFISEVYGQDFQSVADGEWSNDSDHTVTIPRKGELNKWDKEKLEKFKKNGEYNYSLSTILADLVNRDMIPAGKYLIRVCW